MPRCTAARSPSVFGNCKITGPQAFCVRLNTIEVNAASAACVAVECEFQPGVGEPVGMMASPSNGWIHLVLPADRLYAGAWTLILRDANSGQEIERRRLDITKKSEE